MGEETCWTLVEHAAEGVEAARDAFARIYLPVVESYLRARWRGTARSDLVDDAVQDVFLDFIRPDGALSRARRSGDGGFRAFLFGVARNVARRHEERSSRRNGKERRLPSVAPYQADDPHPSAAFDAAWARAIMRAARDHHAERAAQEGGEAVRNVELLRLRFQEGLPIREIAAQWQVEASAVHRQYARARREYARALYETVAQHVAGTPADVKRECARLLELLR